MNALTMRGLALVLTLLLTASVAAAPEASTSTLVIGHAETSDATARAAADQTLALVELAARQGPMQARADRQLPGELIAAAIERRDLLQRLIREDPGEATRIAMPARLRSGMPAGVRPYIEEHSELTGVLAVRYEHREERSRVAYELDTGSGRVELFFASSAPRILSGARVRARGVRLGGAMALQSADTGLMMLDLGDDDSPGATLASSAGLAVAGTFGEQRVLVLLVNWQDNPAQQPFSVEEAHELVFGTTNQFMLENSFQQTWLAGAVHGWFTLPLDRPLDSTTCSHSAVAAGAQEAARNAGVDLAAFDRYVYVFPQTACFPSGTATVGGNPSEAWINGYYFQLKTVAHELGHNLGLFHAGALDCGATTFGDDCRVSPYGDVVDIMGNRATGHFNAHMKERLGWLDSRSGTIATAANTGVYRLEPYATSPQGLAKALKIFRDIDPATGDPNWFYLEFRQPSGFDDFLAGNDNVINGISVRTAMESATPSPVSSLLLDMTPGSQVYDDSVDHALPFGATFTDPGSGLTLSSQRGEGQSALVDVTFGTAGCLHGLPGLSIAPASGQWVSAGAPATYTIVVTNTDSSACEPSGFGLDAQAPGGWSATVDVPKLVLGPGDEADATLTLVSPLDAPDGIYSIEVVGSHDGAAGEESSAKMTVVISTGVPNNAPLAVDDTAETAQGAPVVIDVLANDHDPDGDLLIVTGVGQASGGTVVINGAGHVEYTPFRKFKGQDQFTYTISDGLAGAQAIVTITVAGKGGGGTDGGSTGGNGKGRNKTP